MLCYRLACIYTLVTKDLHFNAPCGNAQLNSQTANCNLRTSSIKLTAAEAVLILSRHAYDTKHHTEVSAASWNHKRKRLQL